MHIGHDFPRPLGVKDAPHIGDPACTPPAARAAKDLSLEATPASEDLRNALCIIAPLSDSLIREALERLITNALVKIEAAKAAA